MQRCAWPVSVFALACPAVRRGRACAGTMKIVAPRRGMKKTFGTNLTTLSGLYPGLAQPARAPEDRMPIGLSLRLSFLSASQTRARSASEAPPKKRRGGLGRLSSAEPRSKNGIASDELYPLRA